MVSVSDLPKRVTREQFTRHDGRATHAPTGATFLRSGRRVVNYDWCLAGLVPVRFMTLRGDPVSRRETPSHSDDRNRHATKRQERPSLRERSKQIDEPSRPIGDHSCVSILADFLYFSCYHDFVTDVPPVDLDSNNVRDPLISFSASDAVDTNSQKEDKAPSPVTTDGHTINQFQCNAVRVRGRSNGKPAVIRMDWCD